MNVPLLDLKAQNGALADALRATFARVLASGTYILGPEVETFERDLAVAIGSPHALGISSGTDALLLALMALEIGPGDEVLCPTFTFFATAGCVARVGATPVFVDACPVCFNLDLRDAERRVTPRTRAIVPVHLFGQAAEMDGVLELARRHGLRVIEDAAQSMGASYSGKPVGTLGDFGVVSFFPTKNLGALGDAGALLSNDPALAERARVLRQHGMDPKYFHRFVGGNFRLDSLQAALLGVKLPHFAAYTAGRCRNAAYYAARLEALPGVRTPSAGAACTCGSPAHEKEEAALVLPTVHPGRDSIWNQFTLRVPGPGARDALRAVLQTAGIGSEIYYPRPLHQQDCFRALGYPADAFPWAQRLAGEVVSLPIYPELDESALDQVIEGIKRHLANR